MYEKKLQATARLLEVMDTLREKCPWDREQTFDTLRSNTIEECFELVDAIVDNNMEGIREELGKFDFADVCNYLCDKLIYRHPHVYGDVHADNPEEVIHNWEMLKLREKAKKERKSAAGVLSGVPRSLPAMVKGYRIGQKAASAGFDWEQKEDVWAKVKEEISEVEEEVRKGNTEGIEEEIGDLFFSLINASRLYGVDPETALERTNKKFMARFSHIEKGAAAMGKGLGEMTLEEMETLWQEAKKN